jgi:dihydrofolate reductase
LGRIVVTEFVSLDGVMEDPGGSESWTSGFDTGEGFDEFKMDETMRSEALLLGRVTYELFAGSWPSEEGEFADKFNGLPKYVVSSTLENPSWGGTRILRSVEEVSKLRQEAAGDLVVHGSAQLAQALIEHDLVDELRLMVYPVVAGSGKEALRAGRHQAPRRGRRHPHLPAARRGWQGLARGGQSSLPAHDARSDLRLYLKGSTHHRHIGP